MLSHRSPSNFASVSGRFSNLHPEVTYTESFKSLFQVLEDSNAKAAVSPTPTFEFQEEIEEFNKSGRDVYVVIGSPFDQFHEKLDTHLAKKGLSNAKVREAFVEHVFQLAKSFIDNKQPKENKWDVTITSTFLKNTKQREWHIDSYDATGNTFQMTTTLAGSPGTLISHSRDYNREVFEQLRDERRHKEIWYLRESARLQTEVKNPIKRKLLSKKIAHDIKKARAKMVLEMERILKPMLGHPTEANDLVLFRGGDVPHSSPVLNRRRLVFTMVEFDEFMNLEHANRDY